MECKNLLYLYIPIYNRASFLERMLNVFSQDRDLFVNKVHLVISDNCSTQNIKEVCDKYINRGLNIHYHRNDTNIGGDANIVQGFLTAKGKYTWVLGSDDIPECGFLRKLIVNLERMDYGVFHLAHYANNSRQVVVYDDGNKFFEFINVWVTFISANIVSTKYIKQIDFSKYRNTCFSQMPLYLTAGLAEEKCAVYSYNWIQHGNDAALNGGYDIFEVFIYQFLCILHEQVEDGRLALCSYKYIKKKQFLFVQKYIYKLLICKDSTNWGTKSGWKYIKEYYGNEYYYYPYLTYYILKNKMNDIVCIVKQLIRR